ncbi:putative Bax inhibitor 1 [Clavelina lepadiformis]|uniref:Transmembrane BAX inhibitor motif-containing protein 6 n=1 Tax=Clavelina lepadiformis TaxID=159417 RepID=A0ABP0F3X7_CLALP
MNRVGSRQEFKWSTLTNFSQLSTATKDHLRNVYTCLTLCMLGAAAGAFLHLKTQFQGGLLSALASIGLMLWLAATAHSKENQTKRVCILTAFGVTSGLGLGPTLDFAIAINPQIIVTAFLMTTLIFISFSLSALFAQRRSYLYLGGILGSGLSVLLFASFMNIFVQSFAVFQFQLYAGAALFCAFVLYDTQLIVEKHINGDNDYIWHSVDLFIDFIAIFRRLIIILGLNEKKNKKNN